VLDPIYISETVDRTMNPTWRHVDISDCGPGVTRLDELIVKVWVRGARMEKWRLLLEVEVDLNGMHFLGKSVSGSIG
jgi:UV radiation resistance-associated gene protein